MESYDLQIYNRWGKKLFESYNISNGWDGSFRSWNGLYKTPDCPPDVYRYIIRYKYNYWPEQIVSGTVSLIR